MVSRTRNRKKQREIRIKRMEVLGVSLVVLGLFAASMIGSFRLKEKLHSLEQEEQVLLDKIEEQELRAKEIEEYEAYTKTKKYVEDVAKEKLGLSYENEIIFKASE